MLHAINDWITHFIATGGYPGIFLLMFVESCLLPVPSEVTMIFAGQAAEGGQLNFWLVVVVGGFANLFGSLLCYWIGWKIGNERIKHLVARYGKFVLINTKDYDKAERWVHKYENSVSFFSRLMPGVRTFISLPCGVYRFNLPRFIVYTLIGSLLWSALLAYIGFKVSANFAEIEKWFMAYKVIIILAAGIAVVWFLWKKMKK